MRFFGNRGRTSNMSRRAIFSLAASVIIGIALIVSAAIHG